MKCYKWTTKEDYCFPSIKTHKYAKLGNFGSIGHYGLHIVKGYSWDGASPKVCVFGKIIGTWDGKNDCLKFPTLVHDILCQFDNPLTRKEIDQIFYKLMKDVGFPYAKTYYRAVRFWSMIRGKK